MALILLVGIGAAANLWQDVGRPFGGFLTARDVMRNSWRPDIVTPSWWPGIASGELSQRDRLIAIDGRAVDANQGDIYAEAYRRGQATVRLTLAEGSDDTIREWEAPLVLFTAADYLDLKIPDLIVGLAFWLLALLVFGASPKEPANRLFAVVCIVIAGHRWLFNPTIFLYETTTARFFDLVMGTMITPFIGALAIHFVLLFPERHRLLDVRLPTLHSVAARRPQSRTLSAIPLFLFVLYGLTVVVAALFAASRLLYWRAGWTPLVSLLEGTSFRAALLSVAVALLLGLSRYGAFCLRGTGPRLRRQGAIILFAFALASLWLLPFLVDGLTEQYHYPFFWLDLDLRYLLMGVPLAFAYVIVRYQTFRRANSLFLATFSLAGGALIASAGAWLLTSWGGYGRPTPIFVVLLAVNLAASLFWSTQGAWAGIFGRLLHWETRSYTAARHFSRRLVDEIERPDLPDRIAAAIVAELELEQAAVWLRPGDNEPFALAGQAGEWPQPLPFTLVPSIPAIENAEVVIPLIAGGQTIGLLVAGKRWDEEIFDERDREILELIAQQAALFLLAARQVEELRQAPGRIAEAQERERTRIAQELHDTVQQFLGRLPFFLEAARETVWTTPEETEQLLQRCIIDVDDAARTVRQIRNNLAPGQLEKGLVGPLQELVERFEARTGVCAALELGKREPALSLPVRHALYRVVQQALDNTAAHAHATGVRITLAEVDGHVAFVIGDNGCGSSEADLAQAREAGSFGLQSMATRITAAGGEFHFTSAPGAGTEIRGRLPLLPA